MKKEITPRPLFLSLLAIGAFFLPFLYVHCVSSQWNPFVINGKKFLVFYGGCIIIGYLAVLFRQYAGFFPFMRGLVIVLLGAGVARMCQGLYHGKPVGYLLLLLMSLLVLWQWVQYLYNKKR
ncbi:MULTISPECIES: hypothetical protein [unclassified Chitinophaga]|uniref:hypothetical protein n=1 Tax=unclassified Chitinophaga TaxID=2619133 RepID=UPI00300F7F21